MATAELSPVDQTKILASDLEEVDLSLIERDFDPVAKLDSIEDQYSQLALLCRNKVSIHPQWLLLAGRVKMAEIKNHIPGTFVDAMKALRPILYDEYYGFVIKHADRLNGLIRHENDNSFNIFAVETMLKSYLARIKRDSRTTILETPQYMYLRVAVYLWYTTSSSENELAESFVRIERVYDDLTNGRYSHASPTLFNAGLFRPQLASCFTMDIGDNMQSISKSWHDTAIVSMNSGGLGIDFSSLRHSEIGQHGQSGGIVPWIKISDQILDTVDQGGKRKGAGTAYLCDWHIDIEEFLDLRKASCPEEMRAKWIFLALMMSDEFMRRVEKDQDWTLFCPNKARGLDTKWGLEFEMQYRSYEEKVQQGRISRFRVIKARDLWKKIILAQIETGMPFILYKDSINRKSNQKNLGTIRLSNLCTEITLFTDKDNIGSCNLGSIALNACVKHRPKRDWSLQEVSEYWVDIRRVRKELLEIAPKETLLSKKHEKALGNGEDADNVRYVCEKIGVPVPSWWKEKYMGVEDEAYFDFEELERLTRDMTQNINQVIDRNYYPLEVPQIKSTNLRNRPLGIGVMGLADVFAMLDLAWTSPEARKINEAIFETMYYAAVSESVELAKTHGAYETFEGSPASKGLFQFDLWDLEKMAVSLAKQSTISADYLQEHSEKRRGAATLRYDWEKLRGEMMKHGLRNSLLIALMPTASSANILGNNECFEPYTKHVYARTVLSGQFVIINEHLVKDLRAINMWTTQVVRSLWANKGSVAEISEEGLSAERLERLRFIKEKHLTVFEIPQRILLDMALDRGRYVCQTQSFNCWMTDPTYKKLNAFHFYGWKNGAKTGMYYLRQTAKTDPINFSLDSINIPTVRQRGEPTNTVCDDEVCLACQ